MIARRPAPNRSPAYGQAAKRRERGVLPQPLRGPGAAQPVEATDRIEVTIDPGDTDKVVDIEPGGAASIQLRLVKSTRYGTPFSFKASDGSTDSSAVTLDGPQVYIGGSVALFGLDPHQLKFTNTSPDQSAAIAIFVARDATP